LGNGPRIFIPHCANNQEEVIVVISANGFRGTNLKL